MERGPALMLLLLGLQCTHCPAFVLRKRSIIDDALKRHREENDLVDALKVIERERRRIQSVERPSYRDNYLGGLYPYLEDKYVPNDLLVSQPEEEVLQQLFQGERYYDAEPISSESYSIPFEDEDIVGYSGPEGGAGDESELEPESVNVDTDELEAIFGKPDETDTEEEEAGDEEEADDSEDDTEDAREEEDVDVDNEEEEEEEEEERKEEAKKRSDNLASEVEEGGGGDVALTQQEVAQLLDDEQEEPEAQQLTDTEIQDILTDDSDDAVPQDSGEAVRIEEVDRVPGNPDRVMVKEEEITSWPDSDINKEWLIRQYLSDVDQASVPTIKRKRSDSRQPRQYSGPDLDTLQRLLELEDRENSNLARALNLATMAQVDNSDQYIPKEIRYLKNAIEDEEEIKALSEGLGGSDVADSDVGEDDVVVGADDELPADEDSLEVSGPGYAVGDDVDSEEEEEERIVEAIEQEAEEEEAEEAEEEARERAINQFLAERMRELLLQRQADSDQAQQAEADNGYWLETAVPPALEGAREEGKYHSSGGFIKTRNTAGAAYKLPTHKAIRLLIDTRVFISNLTLV